jgi:hypothetical protein
MGTSSSGPAVLPSIPKKVALDGRVSGVDDLSLSCCVKRKINILQQSYDTMGKKKDLVFYII